MILVGNSKQNTEASVLKFTKSNKTINKVFVIA